MRFFIIVPQICVVFLLCWWASVAGPPLMPQPAATDTASRLAYAMQWLLIPAAILSALLMTTAQYRFFNKRFTDGSRADLTPFLEINLRATQNTLEQTILAIIAWPALALALPADRLGLVPVIAILFGVGRLLFWMGYQWHPLARAFGFGLSSAPTIVALIWLCFRAL